MWQGRAWDKNFEIFNEDSPPKVPDQAFPLICQSYFLGCFQSYLSTTNNQYFWFHRPKIFSRCSSGAEFQPWKVASSSPFKCIGWQKGEIGPLFFAMHLFQLHLPTLVMKVGHNFIYPTLARIGNHSLWSQRHPHFWHKTCLNGGGR